MLQNVPASARVRVLLHTLAAAMGVMGCSESVAPTPSIEVQVTAEAVAGEILVTDSGLAAECEVNLIASAEGDAGVRAGWESAWFVLTPTGGGDPFQQSLSEAEMRQKWQSPSILAGQTQYSSFEFRVPGPSLGTGEVRYGSTATKSTQQANFDFHCDPDLPGGGSPWVFDLSMEPVLEEMEPGPGEPLHIRYTAGSPHGLVETGVRISGAFTHVISRAASQIQESNLLFVRIPPSAELDQTFTVHAFAVDATGSRSDTVVGRPIMVRDRTPPVVASAFLDPNLAGTGNTIEGQYAPGDTLRLRVLGADNHRLAHVIYTLGTPAIFRDSLAVQLGSDGFHRIDLPVRPEWVGATSLTVQVRDVAGLESAVRASTPGKFSIVAREERPSQAVEVAWPFADFALDPVRRHIYLALNDAQRLLVLSLADLSVVASIQFPERVVSVDLSPDGRHLAVLLAAFPGVVFIDATAPGDAPRDVPVEGLQGSLPRLVRYNAAGKLLIAATQETEARILQFDPVTAAEAVRVSQVEPGAHLRVVRTDDYSRIGFSLDRLCGLSYESASDLFQPCRVVEEFGEMSVSADGTRFSKGYVVYDSSLGVLARLPFVTGNTGTGGLTPDGRQMILGGGSGLMRMRIDDGAPLAIYPTPPMHDGAVRFIDGGATMVVVSREPRHAPDRTVVRVIDLQ